MICSNKEWTVENCVIFCFAENDFERRFIFTFLLFKSFQLDTVIGFLG
jgi:hypothetical protein